MTLLQAERMVYWIKTDYPNDKTAPINYCDWQDEARWLRAEIWRWAREN